MKAMIRRFLVALGMGSVAFFSTGCAPTHLSLVKNGTVSLEYIPSGEETYVSQADVYQRANGIEISGTVKVPQTRHHTRGGHVDVAILSSDGSLLKKASIQHRPRNFRRTSAHKLPFKAYIPITLPSKSIIRIAYHKPSYQRTGAVFDCESNPTISTIKTGASH